MRLLILFGTIFAFINLTISFGQSEWKLEKNANGIKVFTRKYEGADIKEFKAITTVSLPMQKLVDLIEKIDEYPSWQATVESSKLLKQISPTERYLYYTIDMPWPVDDRDIAVLCKKYTLKDGSIKYTMDAKPDFLELVPDKLRIQKSSGYWLFVPKPENQVKIVYKFYGDPGGELPKAVINMFLVSAPYDTLRNIQNMQ